jgi:hypothetical protein
MQQIDCPKYEDMKDVQMVKQLYYNVLQMNISDSYFGISMKLEILNSIRTLFASIFSLIQVFKKQSPALDQLLMG